MRYPDFSFENDLWAKGYKFICGIDEVGRGCFAGPIYASAVVFTPNSNYQFPILNENLSKIIINDSKKLSSMQRQVTSTWIKENALAWGVGSATVMQINKFGIKKASEIAFRQAIKSVKLKIDYLLSDAFYIPYVRGLGRKKQKAIIKGDSKSISIAAASIIAKVERDNQMLILSKKDKNQVYGWGENKGCGTKAHREAIVRYGITKHHRLDFVGI